MRIYDPRIGRFLSVDPIVKSYPMLSPYQYASNNPTSGVDLDGLEYLQYNIVIDYHTGQTLLSTPVWYNPQQHNAHGNLGQGVMYKISIYDDKLKLNRSTSYEFVSRNAYADGFGFFKSEYGNYQGATGLFKWGSDGKFTKEYDYSLPAVDAVDNFAKSHDIGYDKVKAVGETGLFNDWGTTPIDEEALNGWNGFRDKYEVGDIDPFNGQKVTKEERKAAWRGATLFGEVVAKKKSDISLFMQRNYKSEAANHINKGVDGPKDVQANYQLFLKKYMTKDKDGKWIRIDSMWHKDTNGNYTTPKAPGSN
jgi:uncharacterized protein RhaS with RHS repeats